MSRCYSQLTLADRRRLHYLVERKSRYTVTIKNPSRHSRPIMDKIIEAFSPLPAFARQSFTFDRGTEFAGFRALEDGIGACSCFCDPSAPWQKGAVENGNTRIRRFLPGDDAPFQDFRLNAGAAEQGGDAFAELQPFLAGHDDPAATVFRRPIVHVRVVSSD